MTVTEIIQFTTNNLLNEQTNTDSTADDASTALKAAKGPEQYVFGKHIQDQNAVQITSEWEGVQDYTNFKDTPEFKNFVGSVHSSYGEPQEVYHVGLNRSAFGPDGPATANVVEYAQSYFPAPRVTPEFKQQIEEDFLRFDEIVKREVKGDLGLAFGWTLEELEHEGIEGKAKSFIILRGWESMERFEQLVKSDAFKEAGPILFAWKAPFKMVSVCFHVHGSVLRLMNDSGMSSVNLKQPHRDLTSPSYTRFGRLKSETPVLELFSSRMKSNKRLSNCIIKALENFFWAN